MTTTIVHPERYSRTGVKTRKKGVVIHDSESGDGSYLSLRSALTRPGDRLLTKGPPARYYGSSYSALAMNNVGKNTYDKVLPDDCGPYAAPPLNKDWLHICIPGYARQTRFEWLDPESQAGIKAVAKFIVDEAAIHGFPIRRLGVRELQAAHAPGSTPANGGVVDHWTVSKAFGQTDHTDVGPLFPWDILELELAGLLLPPQPPAVPPTMPIPSLPSSPTPSEEDSVFTHLLIYRGIVYRCYSGGYKTWVQHPDDLNLFNGLMALGGKPVQTVNADELEAKTAGQGFHLCFVEGPVLGPVPPDRDPWGR